MAGRWGVSRGAVSILDFVAVGLELIDSLFPLIAGRIDSQSHEPLKCSFADIIISCALAKVEPLACLKPEVNQNPAVPLTS